MIPNHPPTNTIESVVRSVEEIQEILRNRIEFGAPNDPRDPSSTTLAGDGAATQHNGTIINIWGSWAQAEFEAADTAVAFNHNLDLEVDAGGGPNVVWWAPRFEHDGTAADAASTLSVSFETGDTVGRDSIELRLYVGGARTVDATHKVRVTLFFTPGVR